MPILSPASYTKQNDELFQGIFCLFVSLSLTVDLLSSDLIYKVELANVKNNDRLFKMLPV